MVGRELYVYVRGLLVKGRIRARARARARAGGGRIRVRVSITARARSRVRVGVWCVGRELLVWRGKGQGAV